ncbi:VOC family protein [Hymenobacter saemangeumensis]|uniref:VOC family protein n=1 Tax=Hymenobacter saemangeumensis TaxID=1084522 RepID=A0ABP8I5I6_9BACT
MKQHLGAVALLVRDYDEAIAFFTRQLRFRVVEDAQLPGENKRWVTLSPPGASEGRLLLAQAATPEQERQVGNQAGGRVFLFLHTDDFWRDHEQMTAAGVQFLEAPRVEAYGTVAVFADLYGNKWDLLQLVGSTGA